MPEKIMVAWLMFWWFPASFAAPGVDVPKQAVRTISSGDMLHWGVGLLIVLAVFFCCVWGMRKLGGISVNGAEKMRIIGGLSLGMREKVILLQVGKKQLILGVTPGRIDALHVLEGEDCLNSNEPSSIGKDSGFAAIVKQAMKGRSDG
ncbi:flagellar biosynthetic protein FliO [Methylobacter tundripaludum]|uniref:flagellar biosynthetic protein FliO n=1 Tax=Methylobacter tundripaludum TaxID=173365 RepID=UPI00048230AD|nr:flagellar biosynthetic protein FliO [Methylobacter tundripaludum]